MDGERKNFEMWAEGCFDRIAPWMKMSKRSGFVYIMQVTPLGICKIGLTQRNPIKRVDAIESCLPYIIDQIKLFRSLDVFKLESMAHEAFSKRALKSEWFKGALDDFVPKIRKFRNRIDKEFMASNTQGG